MRFDLLTGFAAFFGLSMFAVFAHENEPPAPIKAEKPAITFSLMDLGGTIRTLEQNDRRHVRAFVFVSTECPVSKGYIQTLNELYAAHAKPEHAVEFYGVVSDATSLRVGLLVVPLAGLAIAAAAAVLSGRRRPVRS